MSDAECVLLVLLLCRLASFLLLFARLVGGAQGWALWLIAPLQMWAWPLVSLTPVAEVQRLAWVLSAAAGELLLGLAMALALAVPLLAMRTGGGLVAHALQLETGTQGWAPLASTYTYLGVALFAAFGGLRALVRVFHDSLRHMAVGGLFPALAASTLDVMAVLARLIAESLIWACLAAAPVLLAQTAISLLSALSARAAGAAALRWPGLALERTWLLLGVVMLSLVGIVEAIPPHLTNALQVVSRLLSR